MAAPAPITLMIVVDRSGSVLRAGTGPNIQKALTEFLDSTSGGKPVFDETRDVIGLGSFAGSWKLDFAPASMFRSGSGSLALAINKIPFEAAGGTNTSEALYRAYEQLRILNRVQSVNVILLLTDGRPSAFTATFRQNTACGWNGPKTGYIAAVIGRNWPPFPTSNYGEDGIYTMGLFKSDWAGFEFALVEGPGCHYYDDVPQPVPGASFCKDVPSFPETDAYGNSTTGPVYPVDDRGTSNPRAVRFASFNAADNMATAIRSDQVLHPTLLVVGIHQPLPGEESLDSAWLARVSNDIAYLDSSGKLIFQTQQTPGRYFDVRGRPDAALQEAAAHIASLATWRGGSKPAKKPRNLVRKD
jgi:von Willebrand factor type A domain